MKAIKIGTDNNVETVELDGPVYKALEAALGGVPEHVRPRRLEHPFCMMVDDSGLLKQLPINLIGSYLYETDKHQNPIVGDVFIMKDRVYGSTYEVVGLETEDFAIVGPQLAYLLLKLSQREEPTQ